MSEKKKKFKGNNAKIVGETRLSQRQMKKFQAAFYNVQRDNEARMLQQVDANKQTDILSAAPLGELNG